MVAQIVLVVFLQFLETGLNHIHQFDTGFRRSGACLVTLGNILFARAGSLLHLVDGTVAKLWQIMLNEKQSDVVDALRFLEGDKVFVVAFGGEKTVVVSRHGG